MEIVNKKDGYYTVFNFYLIPNNPPELSRSSRQQRVIQVLEIPICLQAFEADLKFSM
jgi:ribosomal protein S6